jgi:AraC-like DNA-binding protein
MSIRRTFVIHARASCLFVLVPPQDRKRGHVVTVPELGLSLAEIAAASGFCDQAHLNRHFRGFFGTTPASFGPSKSVSNFSTSGLAVLSGSPILWFKALHRYLLKISRMTCVGRSNSLLGVSTWTFSASRPCSIKK